MLICTCFRLMTCSAVLLPHRHAAFPDRSRCARGGWLESFTVDEVREGRAIQPLGARQADHLKAITLRDGDQTRRRLQLRHTTSRC